MSRGSISGLFRGFLLILVLAAVVPALKNLDRDEQDTSVVIPNDTPQAPGILAHHDSFNLTNTQADRHNPLHNFVELTTVATQLEGVQNFTVSGNPIITNIGANTGVHAVTTVNNYGGTHGAIGLERLEGFVSFTAMHESYAQDPDRHCHPGTREYVLRQLQLWIGNPNPTDRIFWLHGPARAGKSAIAQTIANGYYQAEVAATFFFCRFEHERNDGNRLFTTISWQLAFSIPAIKNFIIDALAKNPHLPMKCVEAQFEMLVAHPLRVMSASQMSLLSPIVIIDGVDECSDEQLQRRFLTVIGNAAKDCRIPLRFLISSRPEALIEETLNQFQDVTLRIDLASLDDPDRDIKKYLMDKFSSLASKQDLNPTWPGQEIIQEFVFKSSGNFIFAATVMRFVNDEDYSAESQLAIIRNVKPRGTISPYGSLDELYLEILGRQRDQDFLKTFLALLVGHRSGDLCKNGAILMNISEKELLIRLRRMRSLLKFKPFLGVYHQSFLDFLQDSSRAGQYYVSRQGGLKPCLELITDSIVQSVSLAIEKSGCHGTYRFSLGFVSVVEAYVPGINPALRSLMSLQNRLLDTSKPQPSRYVRSSTAPGDLAEKPDRNCSGVGVKHERDCYNVEPCLEDGS